MSCALRTFPGGRGCVQPGRSDGTASSSSSFAQQQQQRTSFQRAASSMMTPTSTAHHFGAKNDAFRGRTGHHISSSRNKVASSFVSWRSAGLVVKSRSNNNASVAATKETNNNNKKEKKEKKPLGEVAKNLFVALKPVRLQDDTSKAAFELKAILELARSRPKPNEEWSDVQWRIQEEAQKKGDHAVNKRGCVFVPLRGFD